MVIGSTVELIFANLIALTELRDRGWEADPTRVYGVSVMYVLVSGDVFRYDSPASAVECGIRRCLGLYFRG